MSSLKVLFLGLLGLHFVSAQNTTHSLESGPPPDAEPLTWGFYATPEVLQPANLEIEGIIPTWLEGSLYRGGAPTWDIGNYSTESWFDAFSRTHRFEISNGSVSYRNRNGSDEFMDFIRETGQHPGPSFADDPCKIILGAFQTVYRNFNTTVGDQSSAKISVAYHQNYPGLGRNTSSIGESPRTLIISTETQIMQQIDPVTLEPIELFSYDATDPDEVLPHDGRPTRFAAHPAHASDGALYNYVQDLTSDPPTYKIFRVDADTATIKSLATITDAPLAYIHSLFSTENYLILVVWQADYVRQAYSIIGSIGDWDPERKTLFYVISKANGGVLAKYESDEAFFGFHEVNSFEDDSGDIIIDLPAFDGLGIFNATKMSLLRRHLGNPEFAAHDLTANFTRYRLPFDAEQTAGCGGGDGSESLPTQRAEQVFRLPFDTANIELPQINNAYRGQPYRYAYGTHVEKRGYFIDSLVKIDTHTQETLVWSPDNDHVPCEPLFVAAPDAVDEDDGVLLTVAMDADIGTSALVVINATTMAEVGRARMPVVMGYGFHGTFAAGF